MEIYPSDQRWTQEGSPYQRAAITNAEFLRRHTADAKEACRTLALHPMLTRLRQMWSSAIKGGGDFRMTEGWQAAAEQMMVAVTMGLADETPMAGNIVISPMLRKAFPPRVNDEAIRLGYASKILGSVPFLWRTEMEIAAMDTDLPPHVFTKASLPEQDMFWSYEAAHGNLEDGWIDWFAINALDNGVMLSWFWAPKLSATVEDHRLECAWVAYGTRWPDEVEPRDRNTVEGLLKHLAFLNSPYVESDYVPVPRVVRRDSARQGVPIELDTHRVRVVLLRERPRRPSRPVLDERDAGSRQYQHRWWVKSHTRVLRRGTAREMPVTIPRHPKGPAGAPWITKVNVVGR